MKQFNSLTVLAIETSCDDTCLALIKVSGNPPKFDILSNIVSSQVEVHKKWGGVYPTLAKREHQRNLPLVLEKTLKKAKKAKIDLIAVTIGPGLEPCLWVGVNFATSLARRWNLPIVPVNHIEAHILANFQFPAWPAGRPVSNFQKIFPAVCLVVSGGHTQLILMRDFGKYKIIGETRDDAAGECFDKVARILGLGYPGGPAIAKEAREVRPRQANRGPTSVSLPRPMLNQKNYDFSFSGLKTAVLYRVKEYTEGAKLLKRSLAPSEKLSSFKKAMAREIQQAIIDVLIKKTIKAAKEYRAKSIILGGGVSANQELRKQFNYKLPTINYKLNFLVPPKNLSTDNAVMTAIAGYYSWLRKGAKLPKNIKADANLKIC